VRQGQPPLMIVMRACMVMAAAAARVAAAADCGVFYKGKGSADHSGSSSRRS